MSLTLERKEVRSKELTTEKFSSETGETICSVESNEKQESVNRVDLLEQKEKIDSRPFFCRTKQQIVSSSMDQRRPEDDIREDEFHAKLRRFLKPVLVGSGVIASSPNSADHKGFDDDILDDEFHAKLIRQLQPVFRGSRASDPSSVHSISNGHVRHSSSHLSHVMKSQNRTDLEDAKSKNLELTNRFHRCEVRTQKIDDVPGEICIESRSLLRGNDGNLPLTSSNSIRSLLEARSRSHTGLQAVKASESGRTFDAFGQNQRIGRNRAPKQKRSHLLTHSLGSLRIPDTTADVNFREAKKKNQIQAALSKCTGSSLSHLFQPTKKKQLCLKRIDMTSEDIPISALNGTAVGNSLLSLSMSWNRIDSFPCKLVQCLPNLRTLDISHCGLQSLPMCWKLPKLEQLDLSHNTLQEFPFERIAEGLPSLQNLNLNSNQLSLLILPKFSTLAVSLTVLNVGNNDITQFPDTLVDYKNLKSLNLENNSIFGIPPFVCKMVSLKTCILSGNPICSPPIQVSERGLKAIQRYWQEHPHSRNSLSTECSNIST